MKDNIKQPWFRRKVAYVVVAIVGLIAAAFGLVDEAQIDAIAASPILATLVGLFAAAKTTPGSDSTVTADDVAIAAQGSGHSVQDIVGEALNQVQNYGQHAINTAAETVKEKTPSVGDFYKDL